MKKLFYIVMLSALLALAIVLTVNGSKEQGEGFRSGRDTVKQWDNGFFELGYAAGTYWFQSFDNAIDLGNITHYFKEGPYIYLIGSDNLYASIDIENRTEEVHNTIDAFGDEQQLAFTEGKFIELKPRKIRDIWEILEGIFTGKE